MQDEEKRELARRSLGWTLQHKQLAAMFPEHLTAAGASPAANGARSEALTAGACTALARRIPPRRGLAPVTTGLMWDLQALHLAARRSAAQQEICPQGASTRRPATLPAAQGWARAAARRLIRRLPRSC